MPALNFQPRFADAVARGDKRQTVRARRKRPFKPGDKLYLYTGMRRPGARLLGVATALSVEEIWIGVGWSTRPIEIGTHVLTRQERIALAYADGFTSPHEMIEWFLTTHGLPFRGQLIKWGELEARQ